MQTIDRKRKEISTGSFVDLEPRTASDVSDEDEEDEEEAEEDSADGC
jgi:hypothetical protein